MISERLNFSFDIQRLKDHLEKNVFPLEMVKQDASFGGWSVLSSDGHYKDGWQKGHHLLKDDISQSSKEQILAQIPKKFYEYTIETEICTGYLQEVMDIIRGKHLSPYRARIACLSAGIASTWHSDCPPERYGVRLHIPIVTNDKCFFETRSEREHLPADGSGYLLFVNREHRVVNEGDTHRYHLIMDVRDTHQISQFHRFEDFKV